MNLPTVDEINPFSKCLDGQCAVEHFYDKSLEDAEALFCDNSLYYGGDLLWMGPIAFVFYFKAALSYLKSEASRDDSDFVNSSIGILELRVLDQYSDFPAIRAGINDYISFCQHVSDNYEKYELIEDIYGDMRPRLKKLLNQLKS